MQEPNRIPLTNNPRSKEPKKLPLGKQYPEPILDDLWDVYDNCGLPVLAKKNENHLENNSQSIQQLESD